MNRIEKCLREFLFFRNSFSLIVPFLLILSASAHAATFTAFGPGTFTRGSGKPVVETASFNIKNPDTTYTLNIYNGGINSDYSKVSSAVITLNGTAIFDTSDFNQQVSSLQKQIPLLESNQLQVELRSSPGSALTVIIEGEDSDPPSVTITSPANGSYLNTSSITVTGNASDATTLVKSVSVNGIEAELNGESYNAPNIHLTEGENRITAVATDAAGNQSTTTISVRYISDTTPPRIAIKPLSYYNIVTTDSIEITGYIDDNTATVMVNGITALVADNTFTASGVRLTEGSNTVKVTAKDPAGNTSTTTTMVFLDTTAPAITVTSPQHVSHINADNFIANSAIKIEGTVSDASYFFNLLKTSASCFGPLDGGKAPYAPWILSPVQINGNIIPYSDLTSYCSPVPMGPNSRKFIFNIPVHNLLNLLINEGWENANIITITARDMAGHVSTANLPLYVDLVTPSVTIDSIRNGQIFTTSPLTVSGTVDDNTATVTVNSTNATVSNNTFTASISLMEGGNTITACASDKAGNRSYSNSITIIYYAPDPNDTVAPVISIITPPDNTLTNYNKIVVSGTVDEKRVFVKVNGEDVQVSNNTDTSFATMVFLNEGENVITITASDPTGNTSTTLLTVFLDTKAPTIYLTTPKLASLNTTTTTTMTVAGYTDDSTADVTINGVSATLDGSKFKVNDLPLIEGKNTITIIATDTVGNLAQYSFVMNCDITPPTVTATSPAFNATDVPLDSTITVTFSENMNINTLITTNFTITSEQGTTTGTISRSGNTATFKPQSPLRPGTVYTATVKGGAGNIFAARDLAGNALATDYAWVFKTVSLPIEITEPHDGETINRATVLIKGTVKSNTAEVGIRVNGILAEINGTTWAAIVPLSIGANLITATAIDDQGNKDISAITINTESIQQPITMTTNPTSGIVPLNATFTIDTSISNTVTSYKIDYEGDGVTDLETATPSNITHIYDAPGIYYPTVTVTDSQNNTHTETTMVNVLDKDQMDTLLKGKWEGMKGALGQKDVSTAMNYYLPGVRERYQTIFTALKEQLPRIIAEMNSIELDYINNGKAQYRIRRIEPDGEFTYYIYFLQGSAGLWKIYQY